MLNFVLKGKGERVDWDEIEKITWEISKVIGPKQYESVPDSVTRKITANFNQLTIKRSALEPSQTYRMKATMSQSPRSRTVYFEFTMSKQFKVGRVTLNPSENLTTKTAVEVRFIQFRRPKFYKVFCQEGDWTTREHLVPQDNESVKEDVYFLDTENHRCGWVFVDRNLWRTV